MSDTHANCGYKAECEYCGVLKIASSREDVFRDAYEHAKKHERPLVTVSEIWIIE